MNRAKAEEKKEDEMILAELAKELANNQPDTPRDELLLAAVGNSPGQEGSGQLICGRLLQARACPSQQQEMEFVVELQRSDVFSVMFDALVDSGSWRQTGRS